MYSLIFFGVVTFSFMYQHFIWYLAVQLVFLSSWQIIKLMCWLNWF